ncbi:MAG: hypothetical protein GY754_22815 [bacterium]|nr:hypothetical protein [bacterium]
MKKGIILLTVVLAIAMVMNCKKGDDSKKDATPTVKKADNAKLIIGKWKKVGTNCDDSGEGCEAVSGKGSPMEFKADGNLSLGRISQPYTVEGNNLFVGEKKSPYGIYKLDDKVFIWHAEKRNKVEKFNKI